MKSSTWFCTLLFFLAPGLSSYAKGSADNFVSGDGCTNAISGTVYIGSGAGTPQYSGFKQLFDDINLYGIGSDLYVLVQNDITETAQATLNSVVYQCNGSDWTIYIQPASQGVKTITSSVNALMHFNGVTNLNIDGSYNGDGRNLRFRSAISNQSALVVNDGTHGIEITNSIFEAAGANTNVVRLGASGAAVYDILIEGNDIRNRSDLTQDVSSRPFACIGSVGANPSDLNRNISIVNNHISNFIQSGVNVGSTNNGSNFTITGNRFFSSITNGGNAVTAPINFSPGVASNTNVISDNIIGGNAADNSGTWLNPVNQQMTAILVSVGGGSSNDLSTIISGNEIFNIDMTGSGNGYSTFCGIEVNAGRVKIQNNTVGSLIQSNSIRSSGDGFLSSGMLDFVGQVYGIWNYSADTVEVTGNTVANMASVATRGYTKMCGIRNGSREYYMNGQGSLANLPCGQVLVHDNLVTGLSSTSSLTRLGNATDCPGHPGGVSGMMVMSNSAGSVVSNNVIYNIVNTVSNRVRGTIVVGLSVDGTGPNGQNGQALVTGNIIYDLRNLNEGTASIRSEIVGIAAGTLVGVTSQGTTQGRGSYIMTNNMISLSPVSGNAILVVGIMDQIQSPGTTQYYHNSVYVAGDGTQSQSSSGAFVHWPNRGVASTGATVTLRNNLLVNNRTGLTNVYSIASSVNGASNISSDYNLFASNTESQTASWQNTPGNFSDWQTNSSVDGNSNAVLAVQSGSSSASSLNVNELFVNTSNDLHLIDSDNQWPLEHVTAQGIALIEVEFDIDDQPRSNPPTIGADELYEEQCIEPMVEIVTETMSICEENDIVISVNASGTSLNFQWQVFVVGGSAWQDLTNGTAYSGTNTASLQILSADLLISGNLYQLIVSNSCGEVFSNPVELIVNESTMYYPDNDNDGHGDIFGGISACVQPDGYSTLADDCDDSDPLIWLAKPAEIIIELTVDEFCITDNPFVLGNVEPLGGLWDGAGVSNGVFTPQQAGLGTHTISYYVAGDGECILPATAFDEITVTQCLSILEPDKNQIEVFPTYSRDIINVQADNILLVSIMDMGGRLIESQKPISSNYQVRMEKYAVGSYLLCVRTATTEQVIKVVRVE